MKAADVWNWESPKETVRRNHPGEQFSRLLEGLSWIPLKVLLFDDFVGVVTSRHVTKMAVTSFDPSLPKTPVIMQTSRLCLL